jgi:ABC-type multidrug transport system permease subunit
MLRSAWFIARKEISHLIRRRETILWTFVMPILFFYFIGTVTGGFGGPSKARPVPLALRAPGRGGFLIRELIHRLELQNYQVVRPATEEEFESYSRRLIVPEPAPPDGSFSEAVLAGKPALLKLRLRGSELTTNYDKFRVARAVYGVLADLVVIRETQSNVTADAFRRLEQMPRALTLKVRPAGKRAEIPIGFSQAIPGTMVMFTMLVLLTSGSILLVIEREQGLLRRLASTPISRASVVLGKWAGKLALGLVQIGFAMAVGTVLFRMDWGHALPMVCAVLLGWAAFNAALGILLANLARSQAQMAGIGLLTTMVLAALGGCWWPIEVSPDWMQRFALFLPTGLTMDALHKLVNFGYGPEVAVPHLLALLLAALVAGMLAARTFRYQ